MEEWIAAAPPVEDAALRAILDASHECVLIVAANGTLDYLNAAGRELFGQPAPGWTPLDAVVSDHRARWREHHAQICAGAAASLDYDAEIGGARRTLSVSAVPLPGPDGSHRQLAFVRDMSGPRLAEARLRASEALLAAFMKHAPIGMYLKDEAGRYVLLNPEMRKVFGRPLHDVLGRTAAELLPPAEAATVRAYDEQVLATGKAHTAEEYLPGIGDYSWSLVVRFPVGDGTGPARQIGGFDIDVTEQRKAAEALAASREALHQHEKLSALGRLLAGVAHELNNPLAILTTLSVLLEEEAQGSPLAARAAKIRTAAERCGRIVQSFLAMARQRPPERRRIFADQVVESAVELAGFGLGASGVALRTELAADLPPLHADPDQLHQVLLNLIVNAQQAFAADAGEKRITLRTRAAGETVEIDVIDTGPGLSEETARRMFEPFFTTKPQGKGVGLGLSLSLGIVEAHGGTIRYAPAPGGGACFTVALPAAPMAAPARHEPPAPPPGAGRALVVDDEPDLADALGDLLRREGLAVDIALSAREAQARLAAGRYDVILSDMLMPEASGADLYRWIAAEQPEAAARTGFVTGDTLGADVAAFLAETRRPVLEKPFTPEGVRAFIARLTAP